jgi:hypothetical protein
MDPQTKEAQSQPTSPTTGQPGQPPAGQVTEKVGVLKNSPKRYQKELLFML